MPKTPKRVDNPRIKSPKPSAGAVRQKPAGGNTAPAAKVTSPRSSVGSNFRQFPRLVQQVAKRPRPQGDVPAGVDNPRIRSGGGRGLQGQFDRIADRVTGRAQRLADRLGGEVPDVDTQGYGRGGRGNVPPGVIEFPDGTRVGYRGGRNIPRWMGGPGRDREDEDREDEGGEDEIEGSGGMRPRDEDEDFQPRGGRNEDPRRIFDEGPLEPRQPRERPLPGGNSIADRIREYIMSRNPRDPISPEELLEFIEQIKGEM